MWYNTNLDNVDSLMAYTTYTKAYTKANASKVQFRRVMEVCRVSTKSKGRVSDGYEHLWRNYCRNPHNEAAGLSGHGKANSIEIRISGRFDCPLCFLSVGYFCVSAFSFGAGGGIIKPKKASRRLRCGVTRYKKARRLLSGFCSI